MGQWCVELISQPGQEREIWMSKFMQLDGFLGIEENDEDVKVYLDEIYWNKEGIQAQCDHWIDDLQIAYIGDQNWNETWETQYQPIRIHKDLGIRADFHVPFHDCLYDIIITPKMSFGTGHHPTTLMMLKELLSYSVKGLNVLDFGCGTGVLSILAEKLEAGKIDGIDNDPWSIQNALENLSRNNCTRTRVSQHTLAELTPGYDLILANINLNVIRENFQVMYSLLTPSGVMFLSGFYSHDIPMLESAISKFGLVMEPVRELEQWALVKAILPKRD